MAQIPVDPPFYDRANDYIHLANKQCDGKTNIMLVNGSFMFALSRFSAWCTAVDRGNGKAMEDNRKEDIDNLVNQFRTMLEEHHAEHAKNFDSLMK